MADNQGLLNVDNTEKLRLLSLCTGYGGFELALRRVLGEGVRTVAYVEVEAFAVANLVEKIEAGILDAAPVWTDIKTFNAKAFRGRVHIITASYPCQPFSTAGKRRGRKDPRHLWPFIRDIIAEVRPVLFIGENVAGHLKNGFPDVALSLADLGYYIEPGLFTAAEVGAPHLRKRLFFMAYDECAGAWLRDLRIEGEKSEFGRNRFTDGGDNVPDNTNGGLKIGEVQQAGQSTTEPGSDVPDAGGEGLQRAERAGTQEQRQAASGAAAEFYCDGKFPAGPGQRQYEWEEPRTIMADGKRGSHNRRRSKVGITDKEKKRYNGKNIRSEVEQCGQLSTERPVEPGLGRATDGFAHWVDRMRLLGNGIVPQQAAKALRNLFMRFRGL